MTYRLDEHELANVRLLHDHMVAVGPDHFDIHAFGSYIADTEAVKHDPWPDWYTGRKTLSLDELAFRGPDMTQLCGYAACIAGHGTIVGLGHTTHDIASALGMRRVHTTVHYDGHVETLIVTNATWFFAEEWPRWAQQLSDKIEERLMDDDVADHRRIAPHLTVLSVMDDLIHGRRANWFDDNTDDVDAADLNDDSEEY